MADPAIVQFASDSGGFNPSILGVTAGNKLVWVGVGEIDGATGAISDMTSSLDGSADGIQNIYVNGNSTGNLCICVAWWDNVAGGDHSISRSESGLFPSDSVIYEVTGVPAGGPEDWGTARTVQTGPNTPVLSAGSVSTAGNALLLLAAWAEVDAGAESLGGNWTADWIAADSVLGHRIVSVGGTYDADGDLATSGTSTVQAGIVAFAGEGGGGATVTITDASDEQFNDGESVTIAGTGFEAAQGTGRVVISPTDNIADVNAVEMTATAWADTSITATMARGTFAWNTGLYLFVETDGGASNASGYSVQFVPNVYIREDFIDLAGAAQASETGLDVMIWRSVPTTPGTPDEYLANQSLDASGTSAWQITGTGLDPNAPDPIWFSVHKADGSALCTMRKITPSYE